MPIIIIVVLKSFKNTYCVELVGIDIKVVPRKEGSNLPNNQAQINTTQQPNMEQLLSQNIRGSKIADERTRKGTSQFPYKPPCNSCY